MFKATEQTIRQSLIEALKTHLEKKEFNLLNELEYKENGNLRKIPDLVILRESKYQEKDNIFHVDYGGIAAIIETKKLNVAAGMAQVSQYQTLVRKAMGNSRIIASTDFKTLWLHDNSTGNYLLEPFDQINSIAEEISKAIDSGLGITPSFYTDGQYVDFINASVNNLTQFTKRIQRESREKLTGIFLATTLDAEIGKKKEILEEIQETSNKAAAFIIINQLFLYHLLSTGPSALFNPLPENCSLQDVQKAFDKVLVKNFEAIFSCRLLPLMSENAQELINSIIEQFRILKIESRSNDIIGKVFHSLIPYNLRKRIAAYYTGNPAARLLACLTIDKPDAVMADFACGSGTMLVEAYKRKHELHERATSICERHDELLSQIFGFDICMFSGHLAAMNLFVQQIKCFPKKMNIGIDDAFHITSRTQSFLPIEDEVVTEGFVTKKGRIKIPKHFDVILINPPFTDRRRMTTSYIKSVDKVIRTEGKLKYVQGQFHLGLYFMLHCEEFLDEGDYFGIVIPESIVQNVGSKAILDFVLQRFQIYALISSNAQIAFSENTDWKEILLVLRKDKSGKTESARFVTLLEELSYDNADEFAKIIRNGKVVPKYEGKISVEMISQDQMKRERNWIRILRQDNLIDELIATAEDKLKKGRDVWGESDEDDESEER